MQFCTEEMERVIEIAENRLDQIGQQSFLPQSFQVRSVRITENDQKNLTNDIVELDKFLYWTDLKEAL